MFVKQDFGWEITQWILAKKKKSMLAAPLLILFLPDLVPFHFHMPKQNKINQRRQMGD
jgi:hypothetical protein